VEVNGKMSITGSAAVMDINEDLAQQIFERNSNPFYVEESYVMAWMNAHLAPAGLSMQLHREPNRDLMLTAERDADFWDWMTRRLTSRAAYRRDFAAKKSFSKLRSSIAGVYASRGYPMLAERAFMDALRLYPVSSDAAFRTIRESYLPTGQFLTAYRLICRYLAVDPQNARARRLAGRLEEVANAYRRFEQLAALHSAGQLSTTLRCELAEVSETLGLKQEAIGHWKQVSTANDLTARNARDGCIALQRLREFELAMVFLQRVPEAVWPTFTEAESVASAGLAQTHGHLNLAFAIFQSALKTYPTSGRVWLGIALYYYEAGNERQAYECMCAAVRNGAAGLIENDPAVADIFLRLMRRFGPQKGAQ
jgi:tetratricopeptide (TPR) repeat protein